MKKKSFLMKGDAIIFIILTMTALFSALSPFLFFRKGQTLTLSVKSEHGMIRYPLSENAEIPLSSGGYHLTLIIKDGKASVADSDCKDHFCEKTAPVFSVGQTIVCLPAKIVITVEGSDADADIILG